MSEARPSPGGRSVPGSEADDGLAPPRRHLILFGKVPVAGSAKTRLAPALGREGAARLYRAFLEDTLRRAASVDAERRSLCLAGTEEGVDRWRSRLRGVTVRAQEGPDLGARMAGALAAAFDEGAERAVVVGTDHPTLPPDRLDRAFRLLEEADLVLGPSDDGGYYAVGLRREAWPEARAIFRDVPWSTERVLESTRSRAERAGLERRELPEWYDVDRPEELDRLRKDAGPDSASLRVLRSLDGREAGG